MAEDRVSLASHAQNHYSNGHYDRALECLNTLRRSMNGEQDMKLTHNIALSEHAKSGFRDPQGLRTVLSSIKKSLKERAAKSAAEKGDDEGAGFVDQTDTTVLLYNLAALHFQHKQYSQAQSILESLFSVIEPIDERIAVHVCFLLLDVLLHSNRGDVHTDKDRERVAQAARAVFTFIEKPHIFNAPPVTAGGEGEGKDGEATRTPDMIEFRFRLHLYKAKLLLLQSAVKGAKKEVKGALEIFQREMRPKTEGAIVPASVLLPSPQPSIQNNSALFLKANLECLRDNHRKSMKLLLSCSRPGLPLDDAVFLNNMGCLHAALRRHRSAAKYFGDALAAASTHTDGDGSGGTGVVTNSVVCEVAHNCGLALLQAGRHAAAFKCLKQSAVLFYNRPRLWLRLAQCCIAHHIRMERLSRGAAENELIRGVIGSGRHRRVLLPVSKGAGAAAAATADAASDSEAELTLLYACSCLRNALCLADQRRVQPESNVKPLAFGARPGGGGSGGVGGGGGAGAAKDGGVGGDAEADNSGNDDVRLYALLALAYCRLALNDPTPALEAATAALLCPRISDSLGYVAHSYAAEALCMLSRPEEAMGHLLPHDSAAQQAGVAAAPSPPPAGTPPTDGATALWMGADAPRRALLAAPVSAETAAAAASLPVIGAPRHGAIVAGAAGQAPITPAAAEQLAAAAAISARCALHVNVAAVYILQGELGRALEAVSAATALCPSDVDAQRTLLYVLLRQGRTQAALRVLKERRRVLQ